MLVPFGDSFQRAGPIAQLGALLNEFGVAAADVTRGTGVDISGLTPDSRLRFSAVLQLLERAAEKTSCAHFGLLLGSRYSWVSHGLIPRLSAHAPTLRQALLDFVTWQLGYSNGATVYLNRMGEDFAFGYGIYDRNSSGSRQLYDVVAAAGCNFISELTSGEVAPLEILFCHRASNDLGPYERILKVPLRFNQNQCCLVISATAMDHPIRNADPRERARITRELRAAMGLSFNSAAARLRHVIIPQLLIDDPWMVGAARALGQNSRTLRRHLAAEGLTFETVRDEVRFTLARELLDLTDLPIGDISASLAFATHAAFIRAFRRWSGMTPSQWRTASK